MVGNRSKRAYNDTISMIYLKRSPPLHLLYFCFPCHSVMLYTLGNEVAKRSSLSIDSLAFTGLTALFATVSTPVPDKAEEDGWMDGWMDGVSTWKPGFIFCK